MLSARNIHKSFGDKNILNGIDIDIAPGQISCIIGPSGTGKTTLLRALCLLDLPAQGVIHLDDVTYTFPDDEINESNIPWPKVTAVFQSFFLWPHLTLRENIMLPARNHNPNAEKDIEGLINLFE
ncbi:MAG: ATP-binding cassette domain-containing protein, partial [Pseudomonadota bacterium]